MNPGGLPGGSFGFSLQMPNANLISFCCGKLGAMPTLTWACRESRKKPLHAHASVGMAPSRQCDGGRRFTCPRERGHGKEGKLQSMGVSYMPTRAWAWHPKIRLSATGSPPVARNRTIRRTSRRDSLLRTCVRQGYYWKSSIKLPMLPGVARKIAQSYQEEVENSRYFRDT